MFNHKHKLGRQSLPQGAVNFIRRRITEAQSWAGSGSHPCPKERDAKLWSARASRVL